MTTNSKKAMMVTGVILAALLAASWPAAGFAQDVNEPVVTDADVNAALPDDVALMETESEPTLTRSAENWDDYVIVADLNMFSNIRGRIIIDNDDPPPPLPPAEPETQYVLRGVTAENGTLAAYFDFSQGAGRWVHLGDELCRGKITSLTLDQVVYERSDVNDVRPTTVAMGQDLEGRTQGVTYAARTVRSAATATPTRQQRDMGRNNMDLRSMMEEYGGADIAEMMDAFGGGMGGMNGGFGGRGGGRTGGRGGTRGGTRGGFGGGMDMAGGMPQQTAPAPTPTVTRSAEEIARLEQEMMARRQQQAGN